MSPKSLSTQNKLFFLICVNSVIILYRENTIE